jgi:hypothetical protein
MFEMMKTGKFFFLFLIIFFNASCRKGRVSGNDYEGIIIKGDFEPSEQEIDSFESGFGKYLEKREGFDSIYYFEEGEIEHIISNLPKYKRKYSGMNINGKKVLVVEAILPECINGNRNWEDCQIGDGGSCVIHINFDLTTKKYSGFHDNGSG